jgi:plastocyanin
MRSPLTLSVWAVVPILLTVAACGGGDGASTDTAPAAVSQTAVPGTGQVTPAAPDAAPIAPTLSVTLADPGGSGSYGFEPVDYTFSVGETVTFTLTSEAEFHTFTVDALGIDQNVDPGQTVEITHTFTEAGTFELICVPHQFVGMVGTISVN